MQVTDIGRDLCEKPEFRSVDEWISAFGEGGQAQCVLGQVYGDSPEIVEERRERFLEVLNQFAKTYGATQQVTVVRCPSRINLRGMHSEMQHASPNYLPHGREVIMVAGKRDDDRVVLGNVDAQSFPDRSFRISDEMERGPWGDWVKYIDSEGVREALEAARGDWPNYVKAAVLALQDTFSDRSLTGMNVMTSGDVPRGCGMSSSSAMVVSSALACMGANGIDMGRKELVILLGRGEWYVGTRGGFGDHGAMLLGRYGCIVHTPFVSVEGLNPTYIELPKTYQIVIVNSLKTSSKSADQLFAYNQTIFGYSIALTLIKDVLADMGEPQDSIEALEYLGQITPEAFGLEKIYRILRALPERVSVEELKAKYPDLVAERLDRFFGQLGRFPEYLMVRGPALWGIAESERSRVFARLVQQGKMTEAGELMYIGHDGDRLFEFDEDRQPRDYTANEVTDAYLDQLIGDLTSSDPQRQERAELARQPGDYNSSSLELDSVVEVVRRVPGVAGASLTGAGFGGIVLAIAEKDEQKLAALREALLRDYYETQETLEVEWVRTSRELAQAWGDAELSNVGERLQQIVDRKQSDRGPMSESDAAFTDETRERIKSLFDEGKVSREMLFIPANYYVEGIVRHIPVAGAGPISLA